MPLIARLQRTSHAADSATETPSKTRRDSFRRRRDQQISFRESIRGRDSTESPCSRLPPRGCFVVDLQSQSSANKEQRTRIYESKNFTDLCNHSCALERRSHRQRLSNSMQIFKQRLTNLGKSGRRNLWMTNLLQRTWR